jgi:hypothetical protein
MVSILPPKISPWQTIGKAISQFAQNPPQQITQAWNRQQLQKSLDDIKNISNDPNGSQLDTLLSVMKAGAGIPGSEKYLAALAPEILKLSQANKEQNVKFPGEDQGAAQPRTREPLEEVTQRKDLPNFMGQQNYPNNVGPQGGPGQVPQAATSGQKVPLLTPSDQIKAAKELQLEKKRNGITSTVRENLDEVKASEDEKKLHNQAVDEELAQRVEGQKTYGDRAVTELRKVFGKNNPPTSEQEAIFQKKGEEASKRGESEAEINRYLANEATKFKTTIANVKNDLDAPRLQNKLSRMFLGTDKDFEQAANDLRVKLKPLLDLGLYDTANNLLAEKGYYPEERETVINPMSEREKILLNKVPKLKTSLQTQKSSEGVPSLGFGFQTEKVNPEDIKSGLRDLKEANPNFSIVLARKAFEDKNYDWRSFKDAFNDLILNENFELTDNQRKQLEILDTPPLNTLEKILKDLHIIGR